ncbi:MULTISPECIES: AraC family transcriptional regulator [unclassified Paenibacillus]|uniref:AraC family transcriptional regulator n=1 Tax=unclassified Paenibacillus TaxID=185978 RepID=UPI002F3E2420
MAMPMEKFVDHAFNESLGHFPVYCENKNDDPNMHALHSHNGYEFHFSFSSKALMMVGNQEFKVKPGNVFIIRPLVYHAVQVNQESVYRRTILSVEENYFGALLESDQEIVAIVQSWFPQDDIVSLEMTLESRDLLKIQDILQSAERELKEKKKGYELFVKTLLTQLILLLGRTKESSVSVERASTEMREITTRMMEHIVEHCCDRIDMSALAEQFHISKSYMFKIFKMFTGYTPYQYLMLERIARAKQMLHAENVTITQIAARTGFNDSSHFIRTFKEATGMTPGDYKSASREQAMLINATG